MTRTITNYDGAIVSTPQSLVRPKSVEELQAILRDPIAIRARSARWAATLAHAVRRLDRHGRRHGRPEEIVKIDADAMTFTAQAGLQLVDAAAALRKQKLQFMLNIEIGNITLGSAACCQTQGQPRRRRARAGQLLRDPRSSG